MSPMNEQHNERDSLLRSMNEAGLDGESYISAYDEMGDDDSEPAGYVSFEEVAEAEADVL